MAPPPAAVENSAMAKRGPYKKAKPKERAEEPAPPESRTYLAQWRKAAGMTQEDLAAAAGLSVGTISDIESGKSGYSANSLHRLAKALRITPGMIIDVNPEKAPVLWELVLKATDDQRDQIARHARVIVTIERPPTPPPPPLRPTPPRGRAGLGIKASTNKFRLY
jgi:transcriptional regulator with XRE-family HTH domain